MRELTYVVEEMNNITYAVDNSLSVCPVGEGYTVGDAVMSLYNKLIDKLNYLESVLEMENQESSTIVMDLYEEIYDREERNRFEVIKALQGLRLELLCSTRDITSGSIDIIEKVEYDYGEG
jgi:hypothetical protein